MTTADNMLKYLTHKLRTHSINEDNAQEKVDGHDSGTESDTDVNEKEELPKHEMEFCKSINSRYKTTSPTDTVGSVESPAFSSQPYLMYDQHSSEEELEVINGKSIETDIYDLPQRPSSTMTENRKRSLAQSSDEEVRNCIEFGHMPVNFRTSPPSEALKPYRGHAVAVAHLQRAATPLVLTQMSRKHNNINNNNNNESIKISCDNSTIAMDVRSISPPAKLFHCAVSPRRRQLRHSFQKQRPHRPCLDFNKMQQLKARSVTSWRHNNEHTGELSVFCW